MAFNFASLCLLVITLVSAQKQNNEELTIAKKESPLGDLVLHQTLQRNISEGLSRVKRQYPYNPYGRYYPYPLPILVGGLVIGSGAGRYGGYGGPGFGGRGFAGRGFGGRGFAGRGFAGRGFGGRGIGALGGRGIGGLGGRGVGGFGGGRGGGGGRG